MRGSTKLTQGLALGVPSCLAGVKSYEEIIFLLLRDFCELVPVVCIFSMVPSHLSMFTEQLARLVIVGS